MKRTFILLLVMLLAMPEVYSQNDSSMNTIILQQANEMGEKFIAKDYAAFLKYSHPAVVKAAGDEKKLLEETKKGFEELEAEGITFLSVKFSEPTKIITVGNELQYTLYEMIEMKVPGGKFIATASLIAISLDKGKNWYFIDTAGNTHLSMTSILPTLSPDLIIPPPQDPSFEEDPKP